MILTAATARLGHRQSLYWKHEFHTFPIGTGQISIVLTLLNQLLVVAIGSIVFLAPGAAIVSLLRLTTALPAALLPAASLTCSLIPATVVVTASLALGAPIIFPFLAYAIFGVACVAAAIVVSRRRAHSQEQPAPRLFHWLRGMPRPLLALTALVAFISYAVGSWIESDGLYHVAYAHKLLSLSEPTFSSTQLFRDGGPHPGYLMPALHELVAFTAFASNNNVATVTWVMPLVLGPVAMLSFAGLAQSAFRTRMAAVFGALVFVVAKIAATSSVFPSIATLLWPASLTNFVLLPLAISCWFIAIWHPISKDRRRTLALLLMCIAVILVLHVSYVAWLGLAIAGYMLMWLVQSPSVRAMFVQRHVGTAIPVAVTAIVGVAALFPVLSSITSFAQSKGDAAGSTALREFGGMLVGTPHAFHLRPDILVGFGALNILALCSIPLALVFFRRSAVAWYLTGTTLLVLVISQSNILFPQFAAFASASQAKRIGQAMPYEIALVFTLVLGGIGWDRLRAKFGAAAATAIAVAAAIALFLAANNWPALTDTKAAPVLPFWPVHVTQIVLLAGLATAIAVRFWGSFRQGKVSDDESSTLQMPTTLGAIVACAVLVGGATPMINTAVNEIGTQIAERPRFAMHVDSNRKIDESVRVALTELRPGSVVLARKGYSLQAISLAPIYIVGTYFGHIANTEENRRDERVDLLTTYFGQTSTDADRLRVLAEQRVDALLLRRKDPNFGFVSRYPTVFHLTAKGWHNSLFKVDRSALRDAMKQSPAA